MPGRSQPFRETEIIALIARLKSSRKNLVAGDDIAVWQSGRRQYAGSDSLIENVHYRPGWLTPADMAWKLFARNWSDFLCKGIRPSHALLNLNLRPADAQEAFLIPFLKSLDALLVKYGIILAGGDTARAPASVFTLTFFGSRGNFIPRRARSLRAGDLVLQLGAVGGSEYARKLLQKRVHTPGQTLRYFRRPQILAKLPADAGLKAAVDQSDSVARTLAILAEKNRAVIEIDLGKIQVSPREIRPREILEAAEDLAVFAIAAKSTPAFRVIGHIESIQTNRPGVVYRHRGKIVSPAVHGFEHFNPRTHRTRA